MEDTWLMLYNDILQMKCDKCNGEDSISQNSKCPKCEGKGYCLNELDGSIGDTICVIKHALNLTDNKELKENLEGRIEYLKKPMKQ